MTELSKFLYLLCLAWGFLIGCNAGGQDSDPTPSCPMFDLVPQSPYDDPVWHPSGDFIGFNHRPIREINYTYGYDCPRQASYSYKDDSIGFWLIDADGRHKRRVLPYYLQLPAWSPDGQWIAFVSGAQIFKMPFDGIQFDTTAVEQLTFEGRNFFPAWSPDSKWIAYDSNVDSESGLNFIWKMSANGTKKKRIIYTPNDGESRMPFWCNNFTIVYQRYAGETAPDIFTSDSLGNSIDQITLTNDWESYPKCGYNNNYLTYLSQSSTTGYTDLWKYDFESSSSIKLTDSGALNYSLSPNGRIVYLLYNYQRIDEAKGALWIMDGDGSNKRQLTHNDFLISNK